MCGGSLLLSCFTFHLNLESVVYICTEEDIMDFVVEDLLKQWGFEYLLPIFKRKSE